MHSYPARIEGVGRVAAKMILPADDLDRIGRDADIDGALEARSNDLACEAPVHESHQGLCFYDPNRAEGAADQKLHGMFKVYIEANCTICHAERRIPNGAASARHTSSVCPMASAGLASTASTACPMRSLVKANE